MISYSPSGRFQISSYVDVHLPIGREVSTTDLFSQFNFKIKSVNDTQYIPYIDGRKGVVDEDVQLAVVVRVDSRKMMTFYL